MKKHLRLFTCLLFGSLAGCDPVSLSTLHYSPNSIRNSSLQRPLDKTAKQFNLDRRIEPSRPGKIFYFDSPKANRPHLGVEVNTELSNVRIMEMFTFSPSPRMLAYERTLISNLSAAGICVSKQTHGANESMKKPSTDSVSPDTDG